MAEPGERAQRFGRRLRGEHVPTFADLADPPRWTCCSDDERQGLARVMALLAARPAIDVELNGQRLTELADAVGEDRFDCICEADLGSLQLADQLHSLPAARELDHRGQVLLAAAHDKPELGQLAELAERICASAPGMHQ